MDDKELFKRQFFGQRDQFYCGGVLSEVLDLEPQEYSSVAVINHGFVATLEAFQTAWGLFREGVRTFVFTHPRNGFAFGTFGGIDFSKYPAPVRLRAAALEDLFWYLQHEKGISSAKILAHSLAALDTVVFASRFPDRVEGIGLDCPAGLIGRDSLFALGWRNTKVRPFPKSLSQENVERTAMYYREPTFFSEDKREFWKNPVRSLAEVIAMVRIRVEEEVRMLHDAGMPVHILTTESDPLFPAHRIQQTLKGSGIPIDVLPGGHMTVQIDPEHLVLMHNRIVEIAGS